MAFTTTKLTCASLLVLASTAACKPDFGSPPSQIVGPRILAVRGVPAEAAPGKMVTYDALAVDPSGTLPSPMYGWAFCHAPKPPAEANAVSGACLQGPDDSGPSPTLTAPIPSGVRASDKMVIDACQLFGPQTPPPVAGQPPIRPRDPDVTGGFYQPLRVTLQNGSNDVAFQLQRITCPLSNAPVDVTRAFNMTADPTMPFPGPCCYTQNQNPTIGSVTLDPDGAMTSLYVPGAQAAAAAPISAGAKVTLQVAWADGVAESFPVWDLAARELTTHRESLRVSWFTTAGSFELDTSGRGETDTALFTRNDWTAPLQPPAGGVVHFWVVLRDSRGGLDFAVFDLTISP
jgi:hypothetical protein